MKPIGIHYRWCWRRLTLWKDFEYADITTTDDVTVAAAGSERCFTLWPKFLWWNLKRKWHDQVQRESFMNTSAEADQLHTELNAVEYDETGHAEPWQNDVAKELNELLGRAVYWIDTDGDDADFVFAKAVLSICRRVAEFEEITVLKGEE